MLSLLDLFILSSFFSGAKRGSCHLLRCRRVICSCLSGSHYRTGTCTSQCHEAKAKNDSNEMTLRQCLSQSVCSHLRVHPILRFQVETRKRSNFLGCGGVTYAPVFPDRTITSQWHRQGKERFQRNDPSSMPVQYVAWSYAF